MAERRKVEIVSENIDFASSVITILRSAATTLVIFLIVSAAGMLIGRKAYARLLGVTEVDYAVEGTLAAAACILLVLLMFALWYISRACYPGGEES